KRRLRKPMRRPGRGAGSFKTSGHSHRHSIELRHPLQMLDQVLGALETILGTLAQHLKDDPFELVGDRQLVLLRLDWIGRADLGDGLDERAALEWRPAGEERVDGGAETV